MCGVVEKIFPEENENKGTGLLKRPYNGGSKENVFRRISRIINRGDFELIPLK